MASQAAQYSKGVAEAFKGAHAAIQDPETVKEAKSGLIWCFGVAVGINVLLAFLSFPIVVLNRKQHIDDSREQMFSSPMFSFNYLLIVPNSFWVVPPVGLFAIRTITGSKTFIRTLKKLDPEFADRLEKAPKLGTCESIANMVYRLGSQIPILLLVYLLTFVPILGRLVASAVVYFKLSRPYWKRLEAMNVVFLVVSFALPTGWSTWVLALQSAAICLSYELLSPYVMKRKSMEQYHEKSDDGGEKGDLVTRYRATIMAFATPWLLILSVPMFGLCAWQFMEAAAVHLLLSLLKEERKGK